MDGAISSTPYRIIVGSIYPRWLGRPGDLSDITNLREVGPGLYVGAEWAPPEPPTGAQRWALVVDMCGTSNNYTSSRATQERYTRADKLVRYPFRDGQWIPEEGYLDAILPRVREARARGPVLIHCAAGLSRSASVAYAMLRVLDGLSHENALARIQTPSYEGKYPLPETLKSARVWVHGQPH